MTNAERLHSVARSNSSPLLSFFLLFCVLSLSPPDRWRRRAKTAWWKEGGKKEERERGGGGGGKREGRTPWLKKIGRSKRRVKWNIRIWLEETKNKTPRKFFKSLCCHAGGNDNFGKGVLLFQTCGKQSFLRDTMIAIWLWIPSIKSALSSCPPKFLFILQTEPKLPFCLMDFKSLANFTFALSCGPIRSPKRPLQFTVAGIAWILEAHFAVWCGRSERRGKKIAFSLSLFLGNAASEIPARHARFLEDNYSGNGGAGETRKRKQIKRNGGGRADLKSRFVINYSN